MIDATPRRRLSEVRGHMDWTITRSADRTSDAESRSDLCRGQEREEATSNLREAVELFLECADPESALTPPP